MPGRLRSPSRCSLPPPPTPTHPTHPPPTCKHALVQLRIRRAPGGAPNEEGATRAEHPAGGACRGRGHGTSAGRLGCGWRQQLPRAALPWRNPAAGGSANSDGDMRRRRHGGVMWSRHAVACYVLTCRPAAATGLRRRQCEGRAGRSQRAHSCRHGERRQGRVTKGWLAGHPGQSRQEHKRGAARVTSSGTTPAGPARPHPPPIQPPTDPPSISQHLHHLPPHPPRCLLFEP